MCSENVHAVLDIILPDIEECYRFAVLHVVDFIASVELICALDVPITFFLGELYDFLYAFAFCFSFIKE